MKRLGIIDIWREAADLDHNHILLEENRGGDQSVGKCRAAVWLLPFVWCPHF